MVDPIVSLPFETIVQLFSLLSTPQIAISTATSRNWRQAILTDPFINRIIDLTTVRLDEDQTIELVKRLVSVSTHPDKLIGKEIHIDLDNFCFRFEDYIEKTSEHWDGSFNEEEDLKVATSKYLELIHAISDATQGKLSKLFLEINHRDISDFTHQFSELICQSLQLIAKPKEGFQTEVRFSIPFPVAMESGGIDSRRFSIVSEVYEEYDYENYFYDSESCKKLLREVYSFTGVGLKKLGLNFKPFRDLVPVAGVFVIEPYYLLFEEILRSRGTIEELGITFNGDPSINLIYDLVNSLSNLSSLTLLNLFARTAVPVLRSRPSFKLKKLQMMMWATESDSVDWLEDWVGESLEMLEIHLSREPSHNYLQGSILSSILNLSPSLKHLDLSSISLLDYQASPSVLPNLQNLYLWMNSSSVYELFAWCSMPKLRVFSSACRATDYRGNTLTDGSQASKHFLGVLTNSSSTLEELTMTNELHAVQSGIGHDSVSFEKVEKLELNRSNTFAINLLSSFHFPQVKTLIVTSSSFQPTSLFNLLVSSSSLIESIRLHQMKLDVKEKEADDLSSLNSVKLSLPNLTSLEVTDWSDIEFLDLFEEASIENLTKLVVWSSYLNQPERDARTSAAMLIPKSLFSLLKSTASSLTILELSFSFGELQDGSDLDGNGVNFSNLTSLKLWILDSRLVQYLICKCNYKNLSVVSLDSKNLNLQQVLEFIPKHSETLQSLSVTSENAEKEELVKNSLDENQITFPELVTLKYNLPMDEDFLQHLFGLNRDYFQRPSHEENLEDVEDDLAKIAPRLKWYQRKNVSLKILGLVENEDDTDDETVDELDREMSKGLEEKAKAEEEVEGEIEE